MEKININLIKLNCKKVTEQVTEQVAENLLSTKLGISKSTIYINLNDGNIHNGNQKEKDLGYGGYIILPYIKLK